MAAVQSTGNDENQNLSTKESIATFQNTTDTPKEIQNQEIIKSLKLFLEFCVGNNENLTDITAVVNQSYPNATAIEIHECLVKAFPDLQAHKVMNRMKFIIWESSLLLVSLQKKKWFIG